MKFKKIMSLLLVLTLIGTMLTTVSLLNPTAEDGEEATTPTTNQKITLLHAVGKSDAAGIALFFSVSAGNIIAGEEYTINLAVQGQAITTTTDYSCLLVREGAAKNSATLASTANATNPGTITTIYSGAKKWTVKVTPTTKSALFIGIRMNQGNTRACNFYMGGLEVIDSKGNAIATADNIYYSSSATQPIYQVDSAVTTSYLTTIETLEVDRDTVYDPENKEAAKALIRGVGKTNTSFGRAVYIKVPKENIEAGKVYTATATYYGTVPLVGGAAHFIVRNGKDKGSTVLNSTTSTVSDLYSGKKWTEKITIPETKDDLYIGVRASKDYFGSADFYLGNIMLLDENGNNVAPELTPPTTLHGSINNEQPITEDAANEWTTLEIVRMDKVNVEETKQKLFNTFYNGDTMWSLTMGTKNEARAIYSKVISDKLASKTKYKIYIKYSGMNFENANVTIRDNTAKDVANAGTLGTAQHIRHGTYNEYINYYTTPETPTDLYIGVYLTTGQWANTTLKISDIQLIDINGKNYVVPLSDLTVSNLYYSYLGGGITSNFTSSFEAVTLKKQVLDTKIFSDPVPTNRKMVNIKGLSSTGGARLYVKIPGTLPGTYQVSYKTKNFDYRNFALKTKVSGTSGNVATVAGTSLPETLVSQPSLDEATYKFEATDFTDIYVGFDVQQAQVLTTDYIIENLELVRIVDGKPGKNLIDEKLNLINWISFDADYTTETKLSIGESGSYQGSLYKITLMDYDETALYPEQIVNIKGGKEPKYVLHAKTIGNKNAGAGVAIYIKIPAEKVEANKDYTVKAVQKGMAMTDNENFVVRQGSETSANGGKTLASSTAATLTSTSTGVYKWTAQFTTTDKKDLYVGMRLARLSIQNHKNFYLGDIEVIDENGNNIVDELEPSTLIHRAASHGNTINNAAKLSDYFETIEFVDINSIDNEDIANIFAKHKPEDDDAGSEEKMNQNYQLGKKVDGLEAGTYKIRMVHYGPDIKDSANPNFRVVLNGNVKYQTYDETTRQDCVTKVGTNSYKFEATVTVEENDSYIQSEFIVGPYVMSNFNSYVKELSLVKVDDEGNESENLFTDLNVRDWRAANGDFLTPDKYDSILQSINNINSTVADANGNGKVDVADIRIVSKMDDAGMPLTEGVNDITTVRTTVLNAAS